MAPYACGSHWEIVFVICATRDVIVIALLSSQWLVVLFPATIFSCNWEKTNVPTLFDALLGEIFGFLTVFIVIR